MSSKQDMNQVILDARWVTSAQNEAVIRYYEVLYGVPVDVDINSGTIRHFSSSLIVPGTLSEEPRMPRKPAPAAAPDR
jgi:hypothetical protein